MLCFDPKDEAKRRSIEKTTELQTRMISLTRIVRTSATYRLTIGEMGARQGEVAGAPAAKYEPFVFLLFELTLHEGMVLL